MKDKAIKDEVEKAKEEVKKTSDESEKDQNCSCEGCDCKSDKETSAQMTQQVEEYKSKYLRAIADYQNLERRMLDQRIEWTASANKKIILKLLSFIDDLERAELFIKDPNLNHVKESFSKLLKNEGLEEIEVLNKPYDPYSAEVIDMKEGEEDGMVIAVLRKGYTYNGQLLRVAQVTVSKKV
jgi:molecular chaperone GrpE